MTSRVLVTGANGFIGRAVLDGLTAHGYDPVAACRDAGDVARGVPLIRIADVNGQTHWEDAFSAVDCVIHTAATVHMMEGSADYRAVNVDGTLNLARQAADAGVRRFIFLSSIKVNGESTRNGMPFDAADPAAPVDAYGMSKWMAERGLRAVAQETGLEVVTIRPPLVYGPRVKANFLRMIELLDRRLPLPLGGIRNARSLVGLDNLVSVVIAAMDRPGAAGGVFLVSDGDDMSTPDLMRRVGRLLGKPVRLVPVPQVVLESGGALFGRSAVVQRLCGNLQVDISRTCAALDWTPPVSVDDGLARTVAWYRRSG